MTECANCDPNCILFKIKDSGWSYQGAPAVCLANGGETKIGIVPFRGERNSNIPDKSFVTLLSCAHPKFKSV